MFPLHVPWLVSLYGTRTKSTRTVPSRFLRRGRGASRSYAVMSCRYVVGGGCQSFWGPSVLSVALSPTPCLGLLDPLQDTSEGWVTRVSECDGCRKWVPKWIRYQGLVEDTQSVTRSRVPTPLFNFMCFTDESLSNVRSPTHPLSFSWFINLAYTIHDILISTLPLPPQDLNPSPHVTDLYLCTYTSINLYLNLNLKI